MTPADVKWAAGIIARGAVHCVSDETVKALAKRVLELEADAEEHAEMVRQTEREACVRVAVAAIRHSQQTTDQCRADVASAIRARGGK